jgi:hypothetical protein
MPPEEKKSPWRTVLKYAGIGFAALVILPCFLPRSAPAPLEGYIPAELYRIEDGKSFRGLARVRAYRSYEEDIASTRNGDTLVQRYAGYRFDITAIVLRSGKVHPLLFESEETPYGRDTEALTGDSEWRITLIPATQENVPQYKPRIGQWPVLFVK